MMANVRSAHPPPPADNGWGAAETRMGAIEDDGPPRFQPPPPPVRRPAPRDDQDDFGDQAGTGDLGKARFIAVATSCQRHGPVSTEGCGSDRAAGLP